MKNLLPGLALWGAFLLLPFVSMAGMAVFGAAPPTPPLNLRHETSFVVFPVDCNANPPMLFGGKLLAEMDRCAGITTRRLLYASPVKDAVTVGIKELRFSRPAQVKDLLFVRGEVLTAGRTAVTVAVTAERELFGGCREVVADGLFTFVAFDLKTGRAAEHGLSLPLPKGDE